MNINQVLKQQIELSKPDSETIKHITQTAQSFVKHLKSKLKSKKIKAEVFIGGSLAKNTIVKKDKYDVDIFVRFDEKYGDKEISSILGKVLGSKVKRVHGSRDYFQEKVASIIIEIVPVLKIKKQEEAKNITDLSYFHVSYINKNVNKNKKLANEIILAKTFCHANDCYGAESYIHGFSGYALELLICHYGSFLNFIKKVAKGKQNEKIIIDSSKFYKNNKNVLNELNESKSQSPMILIDPTFKQRNALAGLSQETFNKFRNNCKSFLKNPNYNSFIKKNIKNELEKKYKNKLITIKVKTSKQSGDISGTKSKKFFEFFMGVLKRHFLVKISEFDYDEKENIAYFFLVIDKKKEEVVRGPFTHDKKNLLRFKKSHSKVFVKKNISYAKIKHDLSFEKFLKNFQKKDKKIIKEMSINDVNSC